MDAADLARTPLFHALPDALRLDLAAMATIRGLARGETLFSEGERAEWLPILLAGEVKLFRSDAEGREQLLHLVRGPATFAEAAVFGPGVFPASAEVVREGRLAVIPRDLLLGLLRRRPEIAMAMLASMAQWLRKLVDLIEGLSLHTVEERVASYLWSAFARSGVEVRVGATVELADPKHLIAALCGTAPEVLSRTFRRLEAEGAVRIEGPRAVLLDPVELRQRGRGGA